MQGFRTADGESLNVSITRVVFLFLGFCTVTMLGTLSALIFRLGTRLTTRRIINNGTKRAIYKRVSK